MPADARRATRPSPRERFRRVARGTTDDVNGRRASKLMALPVQLHGICLGRPVTALLDRQEDRVVGFEILCGDGRRRFLPFAVARILDDRIEIDSAWLLVEERELEFYRRHARKLAACGYEDPLVDAEGWVHAALSAA